MSIWQEADLPKQLMSHTSLESLLAKEKRRRGTSVDRLVFISIHDVAQFWWCGMYAVRKNRQNEHQFFLAYLVDRLRYSLGLGIIKAMPKTDAGILKTGADITLVQVESLFTSEIKESKPLEASKADAKDSMLPASSLLEKQYFQGVDIEAEFAESYPRFRWNFPWKEFTVVGIPDGITQDSVYEFKSVRNDYLLKTVSRPVAKTQADLYGMFFDRPRKRVQWRLKDTGRIETLEADVDKDRALLTLENFRSVELGKLPPPPKPFKCRSCEVAEGCPIRQT